MIKSFRHSGYTKLFITFCEPREGEKEGERGTARERGRVGDSERERERKRVTKRQQEIERERQRERI